MLGKKIFTRVELPLLVIVWYLCTALASIETKRYASTGGNLFEFTFLSFLFAVPFYLYSEFYKIKKSRQMVTIGVKESLLSDPLLSTFSYARDIFRKDLAVALLQACHIHFTNITICLVDVKFAYMVQVIEPLITLLMSHFMVGVLPAMLHVASLLPVPYGIYLSTSSGISTPLPIVTSQTRMSQALATAFISVATISARNVLFKGKDQNSGKPAQQPASIWESSVSYWRIASVAALALLPGYLYTLANSHSILFSNSEDILLLLRGTMLHLIYNTFSFVTLAKMEPVTHSLLNVIKRILTVTISMFYFNAAWIPVQIFGIFLANIGVGSYGFINHISPGVKMDACKPSTLSLVRYYVLLACPLLLYGTLLIDI